MRVYVCGSVCVVSYFAQLPEDYLFELMHGCIAVLHASLEVTLAGKFVCVCVCIVAHVAELPEERIASYELMRECIFCVCVCVCVCMCIAVDCLL
jgi:hypothetical protein